MNAPIVNTSLFAIAIEHRALVDKLADLDLDEQTLADTLDGESWALESKVENCLFVVRSLQHQQANIDVEVERLMAARARLAAREGALRDAIQRALVIAKRDKLTAGTFRVSLRKNPPSVIVDDLGALPPEYVRIPEPTPPAPAADKKLIAAALKIGLPVPGARLSDVTTRLVID